MELCWGQLWHLSPNTQSWKGQAVVCSLWPFPQHISPVLGLPLISPQHPDRAWCPLGLGAAPRGQRPYWRHLPLPPEYSTPHPILQYLPPHLHPSLPAPPPSPGRGAQSGEPRVPSAGAQVAAETRHLLSHLRGPCRRCCIFRTRFLPPTCSPEPPFGFLTSCFSLADSSWGAGAEGPCLGLQGWGHGGVTPSAEKVEVMLQLQIRA